MRRITISRWVTILLVSIWSLFPVYWALNTSLMSNSEAQARPAEFFPNPFDVANYQTIFSQNSQYGIWDGFRQSMINTTLECIVATLATIIISGFAAYAFSRMKFLFKNTIFYIVIATLSLPAYATLIPLYRIMSQINLVNTYAGVVLVYVSGFVPLALWILYNYFSTVPKELDEAAFVDGASPLKTMFVIMLPLAGPGIASAAIITFLAAWGQFLFPLVLTSDISTQPITVFMTSLYGRHTLPYTLLNAVGVLSIIVPSIIVILLNRYIIQGMIAGSVK